MKLGSRSVMKRADAMFVGVFTGQLTPRLNPLETKPSRRYSLRMGRVSKRETLLDAAARIVQRDGYDQLTLDAVAAEAKVSKGGLLYHFASKEALVKALVERLTQGFEQRLTELAGEDPVPAGRFTRAYVRASVYSSGGDDALASGLIAAVALSPELLEPMRVRYRAWAKKLAKDATAPMDALVVRLALDGLWLLDVLGLEAPRAQTRALLTTRLLELAGVAP